MYYKQVPLSLGEAVKLEADRGFDSRDEFYEVMREVALTYDVTVADVLKIFYNQDTKEEVEI